MKKRLILISILFLCTGCFDYKEINDLAFISAIGIDYQNEEYQITFEVLKDDKDNETSYVTSESTKTLTDAIDKISDKIPKQSTFSHVKLMVIGKGIIENKLDSLTDLFLRNTYFRENFYIVGSTSNTPDEILSLNKENIASSTIIRILKNMNYSSNSNILKTFSKLINETKSISNATCISNIIINNKEFIVDGMILFKNYIYIGKLDNEDAKTYNILTNNFDRPVYSKYYNDYIFTIGLSEGKTNINIQDNIIDITGNLYGRIIDNEINFNIRDNNNLKTINEDFSNIINERIVNFIKTTQELDCDILGISDIYYKRTRIKNNNYFKYLDVYAKTEFKINKKGLIYENKK